MVLWGGAGLLDRLVVDSKTGEIAMVLFDDLNTMMERTVKKANMKVQSTLW